MPILQTNADQQLAAIQNFPNTFQLSHFVK